MRTEFLMMNTIRQDEGRLVLSRRGYSVTCTSTHKGPTVSVEHPASDVQVVEDIVFKIDPSAQRD